MVIRPCASPGAKRRPDRPDRFQLRDGRLPVGNPARHHDEVDDQPIGGQPRGDDRAGRQGGHQLTDQRVGLVQRRERYLCGLLTQLHRIGRLGRDLLIRLGRLPAPHQHVADRQRQAAPTMQTSARTARALTRLPSAAGSHPRSEPPSGAVLMSSTSAGSFMATIDYQLSRAKATCNVPRAICRGRRTFGRVGSGLGRRSTSEALACEDRAGRGT